MGTYSKSSLNILYTCQPDLIILFQEVVKEFDNTLVYGTRDSLLQFELFKKGRTYINGIWQVTNKKEVVTYYDGITKLSNHNYSPSKAIDAVPYPINYKDYNRMYYFGGCVLGIASCLKKEGKITHDIHWGGDWDDDTEVRDQTFNDLCHFEIVE